MQLQIKPCSSFMYCTPPIRWTCSDAVVGKCIPDKNGKYVTQSQCENAMQCNAYNINHIAPSNPLSEIPKPSSCSLNIIVAELKKNPNE